MLITQDVLASLCCCGALSIWPRIPTSARLARCPARRAAGVDPGQLLRWGALPAAGLTGAVIAWPGGAVAAVALAALCLRRVRDSRRSRRDLERSVAFVGALRLLIAELRAGSHPASAAEGAAADAPAPVGSLFRNIAAVARLGGDVPASLHHAEADEPAADPAFRSAVRRVGRAWRLAERHGVALAALLDTVRSDVDRRISFVRDVEAMMAGPRATASVLAGLPLLALALGEAMGASPVAALTTTAIGQVLLVAGTVLVCGGMLWVARLTEVAGES